MASCPTPALPRMGSTDAGCSTGSVPPPPAPADRGAAPSPAAGRLPPAPGGTARRPAAAPPTPAAGYRPAGGGTRRRGRRELALRRLDPSTVRSRRRPPDLGGQRGGIQSPE